MEIHFVEPMCQAVDRQSHWSSGSGIVGVMTRQRDIDSQHRSFFSLALCENVHKDHPKSEVSVTLFSYANLLEREANHSAPYSSDS